MCRKCGEPDRRGSSRQRRARRRHLLEKHGNGVVCPCTWCGDLVGEAAGYLAVAATSRTLARRIPIKRMEQDRLMPGERYAMWNLVPSCGPCNRTRALGDPNRVYDEDKRCHFGSVPMAGAQ